MLHLKYYHRLLFAWEEPQVLEYMYFMYSLFAVDEDPQCKIAKCRLHLHLCNFFCSCLFPGKELNGCMSSLQERYALLLAIKGTGEEEKIRERMFAKPPLGSAPHPGFGNFPQTTKKSYFLGNSVW